MHKHFSRDERAVIASGLRAGRSYQKIADELSKDKGAVWREVKRNQDADGIYRVWSADRKARNRRNGSKEAYRLLEHHEALTHTVEALLDPLVSPECIAELLGIHHQSIYTWIYRSRPDLKDRLPYKGKKRRRYGVKRAEKQGWTKQVRPIAGRVEQQLNWEGDSVCGHGASNLITHVERTSLYLDVRKVPNGTADVVHATLKDHPLSGTLTYDRGSEFALWKMIENDTESTVYFADAHHPWQRGKNENTNGRLRRSYPKRFDFDTLDDSDLQEVVDLMNHTPRKSLGWRMPVEVFNELRCNSG